MNAAVDELDRVELSENFQIRIITSLGDVQPHTWNSLLAGTPRNPFLTHEYLYALESSLSACRQTGWLAQHLILETTKGEVLGALPCYLKNHSQGEYVFDHGWAEAFMRAGGEYYPKLQCAVPFTPVAGPRFLVPECANRTTRMQVLAEGLKQLCTRLKVSSAHITFMDNTQWKLTDDLGFLQRIDQQFHWNNNAYTTFDKFLASLSSRKRKNIKKERKTALADNGITIEWLTGDDLSENVWDRFFVFYTDTGARKWGEPYLTRKFFSMIGDTMADQVLLVMARRGEKYVAGAINFIGGDCLYGRHWGCIEDHPCLHFEVCYYQAMEFAIANGLKRIEAGAQGAHKLARGYLPVTTHSAHWITHSGFRDAISDYLVHERAHVDMDSQAMSAHTPFRNDQSE